MADSVKNKVLDNLKLFDNNATYTFGNEITGENFASNLYDMIAIPNWNIRDFAIERMKFKTQFTEGSTISPFGEPGTYFYKVFFNFNTSYGLLGGLVGAMNDSYTKVENTALQFLNNNMNSSRFSKSYQTKLKQKVEYLKSFGKLLNYLTNECPWFFKNVEGLSDALKYHLSTPILGEPPKIKLTFNQDAIDMRVSTLIDLYKQACFDYDNFKEVIPENLRKFDMGIILFNPPITGVNFGGYISMDDMKYPNQSPKQADYDGIYPTHNELKSMTFKYVYLKNCEININDLDSFSNTLSNELGFTQELYLPITFERHYMYNVNKELAITISGNLHNSDVSKSELKYNAEAENNGGNNNNNNGNK